MQLIISIVQASWQVLLASAPYMLLGFFLAGLLKAFLPDRLVAKHLGGFSFSSLLKASAIGIPLPLCSCGVLPTAAGLKEQGASKGSTAAFLVSTPETGVDSIAISWVLLDPFMAFIRPFSAFITAIFTGSLVQFFEKKELRAKGQDIKTYEKDSPAEDLLPLSCSCHGPAPEKNFFSSIKEGMAFSFGDLFYDIGGWFLFGVLIAGVIAVFVTPEMISSWLGNPFLAMLFMLLIAIPMYVCASASTPIAAALVLKGLNPGAALVFLLAGPAINAASFTVISHILGKKMAGLYLMGIIISSLLMGFLTDLFYNIWGNHNSWQFGAKIEEESLFSLLCAVFLISFFLLRYLKDFFTASVDKKGSVCEHC